MAELADALDLGSSEVTLVQVQVLLSALDNRIRNSYMQITHESRCIK